MRPYASISWYRAYYIFGSKLYVHHKSKILEAIKDAFPKRYWDALASAVYPCIGFAPIKTSEAPALGATRIGGTPDLDKDIPWPVRRAFPDVESIAQRGGRNHSEVIRLYASRNLPYVFMAQIDLGEASGLGAMAAELPDEGRLLFFYDMAVTPWNAGYDACRVIWDQSPRENLVRHEMQTFLNIYRPIEERERAIYKRSLSEFIDALDELKALPDANETIDLSEAADMMREALEEEDERSYYMGPAQAMRLVPNWFLLDRDSLEMENIPELESLVSRYLDRQYSELPDVSDSDWALFDFLEVYGEFNTATLDQEYRYYPHQLLGYPWPVQSDPRYEASVIARFGTRDPYPDVWRENRAIIEKDARDWRLLLQLDIANYWQGDAGGMVYFLIHKDDLAARRFENTIAVYQTS